MRTYPSVIFASMFLLTCIAAATITKAAPVAGGRATVGRAALAVVMSDAVNGKPDPDTNSEVGSDAEYKRFTDMMAADKTNHGDGENAMILLQAAEQKAAKGGKAVFLTFHASWCGPCFMLHHFLNDSKVKPIMAAHFVVQDIDIWEQGDTKHWENPGGTALYKKYGGITKSGGQQGVPFFVLLKPNGVKMSDSTFGSDENVGYPGDTADKFMASLKSASPSLTRSELETLHARLEKDSSF